ncbi:hypothetical protein EV174_005584 [Coemansia sp. RSA 2320]|nr:hypothetical protein EV174_005584 [Coemansia sp. RSA 2320]
MPGDAAPRLRVVAKTLMRSVLLKIHPDFYASEPAARAANHASVQRLQDLLRPVLEDSQDDLSAIRQRELTATPVELVVRAADATLEVVPFAFSSTRAASLPQLQAQRAADLLALCKRIGVSPAPGAADSISAAAAAAATLPPEVNAAAANLRAARAREARAKAEHDRAAAAKADEFAERLRGELPPGHAARRQRLDRTRVFFAPDVPPHAYSRILAHIDSKLPFVGYASWAGLPVMVVPSLSAAFNCRTPRYPGFVMVPAQIHNVTGMPPPTPQPPLTHPTRH